MNKKATEKRKKKEKPVIKSIQELNESRDGGQIALRGYSYQLLYSCYVILSEEREDISFQLEGIEDIDCIKDIKSIKEYEKDTETIHIQLKYSENKQDASFLKDVLKNFVQAYLLDSNRSFQLIYDFSVAKGNLKKIFESQLDKDSYDYWYNVVMEIKKENPKWNWEKFDFDEFLSKISFKRIEKSFLMKGIEEKLIDSYDITTDNLSLYANSIKMLCFNKMEHRGFINKKDIDNCIESVKFDISKGPQNPAHSWIRRLDYSAVQSRDGHSFYEGKKATPSDIINEIPIRRPNLEKEIINSIQENTITIIKSSSGQGKTTLALQVAYNLSKEYVPYQLLWCSDIRDLGNTVQYFKARIKVGEKVLIIIDNLDVHSDKWNHLAQLLQSELPCHYKLLITTREDDWYNYSGDLSKIQSTKVIKPVLDEKEAMKIYEKLKNNNQLHPSINNWRSAWNKVSKRQLLIEYIYLLTHGEMLSERIASQISEIGKSETGKAKCEILRKVCFADVCGIKLSIRKLLNSQNEKANQDFSELIKSMKFEFFIDVNDEAGYIEGIHAVRSKHVIDKLHENYPMDYTALDVIKITEKSELPALFSHLPEFDFDKDKFLSDIIETLWNNKDLSDYISAIQGLFSGSVMQYYRANKAIFDDANNHGGLPFLSTDICPFTKFNEFGISSDFLKDTHNIFPDNKNIKYVCNLKDTIPICDLPSTFVYIFCQLLYKKLSKMNFEEINDLESYASIVEWLYNMNPEFNLSMNIPLNKLWINPNRLSLDGIATFMYISFCGNKDIYLDFVKKNLNSILIYLKHQTNSLKIEVDNKNNTIHVEYILRLEDIKKANEESVSRLKYICKTLPIFDKYCADAQKPVFNLLSAYTVPDDAHKEMPIRNLVIMFRQNMNSLWNKTIMSNYEFDTATEWIEHWLTVRNNICVILEKYSSCIYKLLGGIPLGSLAKEVDKLCEEYLVLTTGEKKFPGEYRPFKKEIPLLDGFVKIKTDYFQSIQNFMNQVVGFLSRKEEMQRLAMINLITAESSLLKMQAYFEEITIGSGLHKRHLKISDRERRCIEQLLMNCNYYQGHEANEYFYKESIKKWYQEYLSHQLKMVEEGLESLKNYFTVQFPVKEYRKGILSYYPVILQGFDMTIENKITQLLISCLSFSEAPFDYLVIISKDNEEKINSVALQFPRHMLYQLKEVQGKEDNTLYDGINLPYPVEVTKEMLECFEEEYALPEVKNSETDTLPIGDIAEELWIYSKMRDSLIDKEDLEYLKSKLQTIQTNITEMLSLLDKKISLEKNQKLNNICEEVFKGKEFNDSSFNKLIEDFIPQK